MDTMYLDRTDKSCISVFMKDVAIIPAGTTVYSLSVKDKKDEYDLFADKYDIHFIFDDCVPAIDFYSIPYIDILATDSLGGFLGTLGEISGFYSDAPICYIDSDKNCFVVAPNFRELVNSPEDWREKASPCEEIVFFKSKEEAMKNHEFVDLSALQEEAVISSGDML